MAIKNLVRRHPESGWIEMTKETKMEKPDYLKIFKKAIFRILKKACKNQNRFSTYIPHFPFSDHVSSISCNSAAFSLACGYTFKAPQPPTPSHNDFLFPDHIPRISTSFRTAEQKSVGRWINICPIVIFFNYERKKYDGNHLTKSI